MLPKTNPRLRHEKTAFYNRNRRIVVRLAPSHDIAGLPCIDVGLPDRFKNMTAGKDGMEEQPLKIQAVVTSNDGNQASAHDLTNDREFVFGRDEESVSSFLQSWPAGLKFECEGEDVPESELRSVSERLKTLAKINPNAPLFALVSVARKKNGE